MKKIAVVLLILAYATLAVAYNLDCYSFTNADEPLFIPTYVEESDETCHPDVLYFPEGWNGWRYWMSHTPYPNTDIAYENPSIVVSNDGINWFEPDGIINPVADVYQGTDMNNNYNSDSHLFMSHYGNTMNLIWRRKNGWNNELIYMKSSFDGIVWSATSTILSVFGTTPSLNENVLSPVMVHNGHNYLLWTVNTKVDPRSVYLRYGSSSYGNWSEPILTDIGEFPLEYRLWHMDVEYIDGYYHMLAAVGLPSTQEGRVLYLGKSVDGIHWIFGSQPIMTGIQGAWDARLYRSAFIQNESGLGYKCWYGSMDHPQWRIGYTETEVNGYLESPQNLQIDQSYDGMNHFQLSWNAPNYDVTGYKIYCNHQEIATLYNSGHFYQISTNQTSEIDGCTVLAVTALYDTLESDPVVRKMPSYISNSITPIAQIDNISIYPNPFIHSFTVNTEQKIIKKMTLYNIKGQVVGSYSVERETHIVPENSLGSGIYYCVFEGHNTVVKRKILRIK